jgi:hypothetical protein
VQDREKQLKREKEKEELRRKISEKRKKLDDLHVETSAAKSRQGKSIFDIDPRKGAKVKSSRSKIDINTLRSDEALKCKVEKRLKKLGLIDTDSSSGSDSDSTVSDSVTSDSSDSFNSKLGKVRLQGKKSKSKNTSGIEAKSSDRVKFPQKYPHSQLRFEYVSQNYTFEELTFNLFIAGELETIGSRETKSKEKNGRIELLRKLMYLSSNFSFSTLKSYYAAVLREIELGNKSWDDDFSYLDTTLLIKGTRDNSKVNKKKNEKSNSSGSEEKLWFCSLYQRNKCSHDSHHLMVVKGKMRHAQHICATCWQKEQRKLEHPECSSACPHNGA